MKSAVLVAASSFNAYDFVMRQAANPFDEIVAVDVGYSFLKSIESTPTHALGDFDSLGYVPRDVPVITFPEEKDDSDLALALDWCLDQQFDAVTVYGAFAGRLDPTLSSLQAMTHYALRAGQPVEGVGQNHRLVALPGGCSMTFTLEGQDEHFLSQEKDERAVSVIAQTDIVKGLTIRGLKYELEQGTLTNTVSLGLSNELVGREATIFLEQGCVIVIMPLGIGVSIFEQKN